MINLELTAEEYQMLVNILDRHRNKIDSKKKILNGFMKIILLLTGIPVESLMLYLISLLIDVETDPRAQRIGCQPHSPLHGSTQKAPYWSAHSDREAPTGGAGA